MTVTSIIFAFQKIPGTLFMLKNISLILFILFIPCCSLFAQDILPLINVKNLSGRIAIKWRQEYPGTIKNINIQRSYDSLKNYTSIATIADPQKTENEYVDPKPPYNNMFYRIFVAFEGGRYVFSKVSRPVKPAASELADNYPSKYIFTGKGNNLIMVLPGAESKKYLAKFFDKSDKPLFELNKLNEPRLILDKVNFLHTGWFYFELYENGKLLEKNKFYLPDENKSR